MKLQPTNKVVSDPISTLIENGFDVNINIKTDVLVRLGFFAIILTVVISGVMYGMHVLKKM